MPKKSKAELADEGKEIRDILSAAKQKEHSFALFHGKDDLIFKAHKTKSRSQMRQAAKADGATQKGAVGFIANEGAVVKMIVEDPSSTPANFAKAFRKFLLQRGISKKVLLVDTEGTVLDDGEDDAPAEGSAPAATPPAEATPDIGEDIEVVLDRLRAAFKAMGKKLISSQNTAPAAYKAKIDAALELFKKSLKAQNPDNAKKALLALNKLVVATPSAERIGDEIKTAGTDPEKLGKLDGLVKTCAKQINDEDTFLDSALPQMRDMRKALKAAIDTDPPPKNIEDLRKMKSDMDDMFYAAVDNPPRSHGPEFHGPGLSRADLESRVMRGRNPRTGGRAHGAPAYSASSFLDKSSYVDSQMAMRTKALKHLEDSGMRPHRRRPKRLPVMEGRLADVLGPSWATAVHGVKRKNRRNRPDECVDANWGPDSKCQAFYDLMPDGSLRLVTLYPKPVAAPPPPRPRPAAPRARRNRNQGGRS